MGLFQSPTALLTQVVCECVYFVGNIPETGMEYFSQQKDAVY